VQYNKCIFEEHMHFLHLAPKLNESRLPLIPDKNDEPACYTLINSHWYTIQQDKSITFPNFLEYHMMITFLLTTIMRWKDEIKYDIDVLYIMHSC
jgi:hypothetical protein